MNNQTFNSIDLSGQMITNEPNRIIMIRCDSSKPSYVLTTAPSPLAKDSMIYVQGMGEFYCYKGSYTNRSNMQSYLVMITLSGYEMLNYMGVQYRVAPGHFFWIDCMEAHEYCTLEKEQPRHAMWVHFSGSSSKFYYRQFLRLNNNSVVCRLPDDSNIVDDIKELIRMYDHSAESLELDIAASAIVTRIAVECVQATTKQQVHTPIPKVIQSVKSYISRNYHKDITLDVLADEFSLNKFHLQKQFKRYIGLSPSEFLIHTRLTQAKELLRTTDYSIGSISEEIGVKSISSFSRMFKKYENTTPIEYRRSWIAPQVWDEESRN